MTHAFCRIHDGPHVCSLSQTIISRAHDTVKGRILTFNEERTVAERDGTRKRKNAGDLQREVHIAVGMEVMVTRNIETDLDITNGARGTVVDIFLHPGEPDHDEEARTTSLTYPPAFILVKLNRTRASRLKGLDESVIPIEPITRTFRIDVHEKGTKVTRTISRRQLPITAAYALTDYRAQGQTIGHVLVDIATPPTLVERPRPYLPHKFPLCQQPSA
jgi:ATP-dependent exoDNAse (exonuclease V) alpha subunit